MASLINSPKHIKKDQYQLHRLFKKTEEKEILSIFYDMETKPRKENKTAINTPAWQGDCRSSGGLGPAVQTSGMGVRVDERENGET